MQHFRMPDFSAGAEPVVPQWQMPVLLVGSSGREGYTARALDRFGLQPELIDTIPEAISLLQEAPSPSALLIMRCRGSMALQAGRRLWADLRRLGRARPVVLISEACQGQSFPCRSEGPIILRAPVSALALRLAFEACFPAYRMMAEQGQRLRA